MINNERIIYSNVEETMINRRSENGMRHSSVRVALVLGWILVGCGPTAAIQAAAPNMVVVLADDLGYGDLGCYGHKQIKTPNIDQFAAQGLRLTHCYSASANCSPARAGLMTGRTPYRMGIHSWIPFGSPMHVGRNEIMVPKLLRQAGYQTCHVGKWHLSGNLQDATQPQPGDHGFDHWFATQNNALPSHENPDNFVRNGDPVGPLKGYAAPLVAREAINWLKHQRDDSKPFFLFVCFHEPHEPIATDKRFTDWYRIPGKPSPFDPRVSQQAAHHGNVSQLDFGFGKLMAALDELELSKDTLVYFTSDNGPAITSLHPHGSTGGLRDKKGYLYEGGIRVPGIVRWPGHIQPGAQSDEAVSGVDVLPTLCEIAGVQPPSKLKLDGVSIVPLLSGTGKVVRDKPLYWQFNFARGAPKVAIRSGDWKLLAEISHPLSVGGDIRPEDQAAIKRAELTRFELYHLGRNQDESQEVSAKYPQELADMKVRMRQLYQEVREDSPTWPAWKWPRVEGARIKALREQKAREFPEAFQ